MDDLFVNLGDAGNNLLDGRSGQCRVVMDKVAQLIKNRRNAASRVEIFHEMLAARVHRGKLRGCPAQAVKCSRGSSTPASRAMESRCRTVLRGAAEGQIDADGVFEGGRGQDLARGDPLAHQLDDPFAGSEGDAALEGGNRQSSAAARPGSFRGFR